MTGLLVGVGVIAAVVAIDDWADRFGRTVAARWRRWADQRILEAEEARRRDAARALHPAGRR